MLRMSLERGAEGTQQPKQKLANINEYATSPVPSHVAEFARLLSDRLTTPKVVPMGLVLASVHLVTDLLDGIDTRSGEPIESNLVGQSPDLYSELRSRLPQLAAIAFSPAFAEEVRRQSEEILRVTDDNSAEDVFLATTQAALRSLPQEPDPAPDLTDQYMRLLADNPVLWGSYFLKDVRSDEGLPEVDLPGLDPAEIIKKTGSLPEDGILLEARITRGGNGVFAVYDYDYVEKAELDEHEGAQRISVTFLGSKESKARELDFSYEHPDYPDKETEPSDRADSYSYLAYGFGRLDAITLNDGGRLLVMKEPRRNNSNLTLDQHGWKAGPYGEVVRSLFRWFPSSDVQSLTDAVEMVTRDLMGVEANSASRIKQAISDKLEG
jgi:hypothetical protein